MRKSKGRPVGHTIGGILVGFDAQVFRTTPPVSELVAKGTPLRAIAADGGGTLAIGMPEDDVREPPEDEVADWPEDEVPEMREDDVHQTPEDDISEAPEGGPPRHA